MFFSRKKTPDEIIADTVKAANEIVPEEKKKDDGATTGNPKLDIEFTKIKAQLEGFGELRKANSERFSRISEQIGEIRGMIMDTNKSVGTIEVKATKASDLVSSVQPEKLMIDVRKVEGKVEALHANIESNEAMMKNMMAEMKDMRQQINFYKGIDQVVKLNDDVKKELMEMKKIEAIAKRHADKIDTVFIEVNKKFSEFDKFNDVVKDLSRSFRNLQTDFDKVKIALENKEDKKEFVNLLNKFNSFEKHTTNIIDLLDKKSRNLKSDIDGHFERVKTKLESKFKVDLKDTGTENTQEQETEQAAQAEPVQNQEENKDDVPVEKQAVSEQPKEQNTQQAQTEQAVQQPPPQNPAPHPQSTEQKPMPEPKPAGPDNPLNAAS